jgi:hypothetical protein
VIVEDTPRRLVDDFPYSAAKYRVEEYLDGFERRHPEVIVTRFRPSILIGARFNNPLGEVFGRTLDRGLVFGTSPAPMPVVWDEDVADAFMLALKKKAGGAFNVSADDPATSEEIARETGLRFIRLNPWSARALPVVSRLSSLFDGGRGAIDPSWYKSAGVTMRPSSEKAKRELGWAPKHPTALAVMKHYLATAHGRTDPRIATFMKVVAFSAGRTPPEPEMTGMTAVVHLAITGKGGADYTLRVKDSRLSVERGVPRPPTSVATLDAATFRDLLAGRQTYATAMVTGRIRFEGDTSGGFLVPGLFTRLRAGAEANTLRGRALRTFARYLSGTAGGAP